MRHAIEYQGAFALNLDRIRKRAMTYLHADGSERPFLGPKDVNGVRFGLLEKPGKEFVIARVQMRDADIPLEKPVPSLGTGPHGTLLSRARALDLLQRIRESVSNDVHAGLLDVIISDVNSSSDD